MPKDKLAAVQALADTTSLSSSIISTILKRTLTGTLPSPHHHVTHSTTNPIDLRARILDRSESHNPSRLIAELPSFNSHRSHEGFLPAWSFDDHRGVDSWPASTGRDPYTTSREGDSTLVPASASSTMPTTTTSHSRKRPHAIDSHNDDGPSSTKRSRISNDIEEIDLATEGSDQAILEKERAELVQTQRGDDEDQPKSFGKITCMICLDNFTNLTTTACGTS